MRRLPPTPEPRRLMLPSPAFWLAALTLLLWVLGAVEMGLGTRRLRFLHTLPPLPPERAPRASVVIAARDEARGLEAALSSVLEQRYPALEVVVVDDRSTDGTGAILERMQRRHPALRVLHVESLPPGWLGKNHALQVGASAATGEWILFTDADVVLEPLALARGLGYAVREGLDHVAAAPELRMPGLLTDLFAGVFSLFFARYARPWKARDPESPCHVGVGAFNLVRTAAYRAAGGHEPIRMRPDDDLKLGKLLKRSGARQDLLFGNGAVWVQWYASVGEAVRGLEKNAFAGAGYSVLRVLGATLALLVLNVWPFVALALTGGAAWVLNLATVAVIVLLYAASTRASGAHPLGGLAFPLATLLLVYALLRSTTLTLRHGGIRWRGTLYPLEALRANRI